MKSVAVAAFLALAATANAFVVSPTTTSLSRTSTGVAAQAPSTFMSRRVAGTPVVSGALKMSTSMNDAGQPTLEQVRGSIRLAQSS